MLYVCLYPWDLCGSLQSSRFTINQRHSWTIRQMKSAHLHTRFPLSQTYIEQIYSILYVSQIVLALLSSGFYA